MSPVIREAQKGLTTMKPTAPTLIVLVVVLAVVVVRLVAPASLQVPDGSDAATITGQGLLSSADAISLTLDWISSAGEPFQVDIMEPRLMTYGDYHRLDSADGLGTPGPMTSSERAMLEDPVWVVAFSVNINLARTSLFGGSDSTADYYMGAGGEDYVWPDGYSRGSLVFDARTGDELAQTAHSRVSTNDFFFDRVLAYPTQTFPLNR